MSNKYLQIEDHYLKTTQGFEIQVQVCKGCGAILPPEDYRFYSDASTGYRRLHLDFHERLEESDEG